MGGVKRTSLELYVHIFPPSCVVELISFKRKRIAAFRKNLIEMAELEIKHAKVSCLSLK